MCFRNDRPDPFRNTGTPQFVGAIGGGLHKNPDWDDGDDGDRYDCRRPVLMRRELHDEGEYVCTACGHTHDYERCARAGDECLTWCEACGKLETLEKVSK